MGGSRPRTVGELKASGYRPRTVKDEMRAKKLFENGCNAEHGSSCYDLAVMYSNGEGMPKNKAKAKTLFSWWSAVKPGGAVFLTGYSEGGYATMAGARAVQ